MAKRGKTDNILSLLTVSLLFVAFAVVGVCNAVNIIDGFNGLAKSCDVVN